MRLRKYIDRFRIFCNQTCCFCCAVLINKYVVQSTGGMKGGVKRRYMHITSFDPHIFGNKPYKENYYGNNFN